MIKVTDARRDVATLPIEVVGRDSARIHKLTYPLFEGGIREVRQAKPGTTVVSALRDGWTHGGACFIRGGDFDSSGLVPTTYRAQVKSNSIPRPAFAIVFRSCLSAILSDCQANGIDEFQMGIHNGRFVILWGDMRCYFVSGEHPIGIADMLHCQEG